MEGMATHRRTENANQGLNLGRGRTRCSWSEGGMRMKKLFLGLATAALLAMGGAATADCTGCEYDLNLNVNGTPFYGNWALVNDRPFVGVEAFSDAVGLPRSHYYQGWSIGEKPSDNIAPLEFLVRAGDKPVETIRFGGVTMIDLYKTAEALDLPVHHNFNTKTIQVGDRYVGHELPGAWYRRLSRTRGWTDADWMQRLMPGSKIELDDDDGVRPLRRL